MKTIKIKLPYVMDFDDYHEIKEFVARFKEISNVKLKFTEIMCDSDYGYKAIFYIGKQDKAYKNLIKKYKQDIKKFEEQMYGEYEEDE